MHDASTATQTHGINSELSVIDEVLQYRVLVAQESTAIEEQVLNVSAQRGSSRMSRIRILWHKNGMGNGNTERQHGENNYLARNVQEFLKIVEKVESVG